MPIELGSYFRFARAAEPSSRFFDADELLSTLFSACYGARHGGTQEKNDEEHQRQFEEETGKNLTLSWLIAHVVVLSAIYANCASLWRISSAIRSAVAFTTWLT